MAIAVTLADGYAKVADRAVMNLDAVKEARHEIHGAVEPLGGITREADRLIGVLDLAKAIASLQTPEVGEQTVDIMRLTARLVVSMMTMGAENRRHVKPRELQTDDYEYAHLETMLGQLERSREVLAELISAGRVGLQGNARDGWAVDRAALLDANQRARSVLGTDLIMFQRLQHRINQTGADAIIRLNPSDTERLGLPPVTGNMVEQWRAAVGEETGIVRTS